MSRNPIFRPARSLCPQVIPDKRSHADDEAAREEIAEASHDERLKAFLEKNGYYNVRILSDGVICNRHFLFTDAVIIGANWGGYERRICYPGGSGLAEKMCLQMQSVDDPPLPGYTAIK